MKNADAKLISMLAAYRKGSNFGPDFTDEVTQKFWISRLSGISHVAIQEAMNKLAGDPQFPTVNQVIAASNAPGDAPDASQAFDWLWKNLDRRRIPTDLNILLARTIDAMGGWLVCCDDWRVESRDFHRRSFVKIYGELAAKKANRERIGGSLLALESAESKKEGLGITEVPNWKKNIDAQIRRDQIAIKNRGRSKCSLGDFISSISSRLKHKHVC